MSVISSLTILHVFPVLNFFEAIVNWRHHLGVTMGPERVEPAQSFVGGGDEHMLHAISELAWLLLKCTI
jgi:hypothetical protein